MRPITAILAMTLAAAAGAGTIELQPDPANLYDLTHQNYYTWGFELALDEGEVITTAWLFFDNIWNWVVEPNVLYINLLEGAPLGVSTYWDWQNPTNAFEGQGTHLVTYVNLPPTPQDLTYEFTPEQRQALADYAADGAAAIGFDPDCHYYNCGITLHIETSPVIPEPSSLALAATGMVGLVLAGRGPRRLRG